MVATDRVKEIFADACALHDASLNCLAQGDIRNATEKAWMATRMATDALILSRFEREPRDKWQTSEELERLAGTDPRVEILIGRYHINLGYLHQECSRLGLCDPVEAATDYIHETTDYIRDAEKLAEAKP